MKEYYLATYQKPDGTYGTALVLSDSEAKAEEHFKKYKSSSVRIAAEDEMILLSQQRLSCCRALINGA